MLEGVSARFGVNYVGNRSSFNHDSSPRLDAFTHLDAGIGYRIGKHHRLDAHIKNLTDKVYVLASDGNLRQTFAQGRQFNATWTLAF